MDLSVGLPAGLSLRISDEPVAGDYPTHRLQKGLLLLDEGQELAEEGVGFGVPVLKRGAQTVFPGAVELKTVSAGPVWEVTASFRMNLVERLTARGGRTVRPRLLYAAKDSLAALHRRLPALRRPLTVTSTTVRRRLGWSTTYEPVETVAVVPVTYGVHEGTGTVRVSVDLGDVPGDAITEVVVMNELGARCFDRFTDSEGRALSGDAIGTWDAVTAASAAFGSSRHGVSFSLSQAPGSRLRRGRELIEGRLAWAGFGYSLRPGRSGFSYDVRVERVRGRRPVRGRLPDPGRPASAGSVLLIYPFFRRSLDRSRFRFPPLGPAYVAASLRQAGYAVRLLDCTFMSRERALRLARAAHADVVGISCMATMRDDALWLARRLRGGCELLIAGGPLPTCEPESFAEDFDVVVRGEGEQTILDVLAAHAAGADPTGVPGVVGPVRRAGGRHPAGGGLGAADSASRPGRMSPPRALAADLDALPFPARYLLPNAAYIRHGRRRYGRSVTTVMSTRGCPFACDFCSNVVFGSSYRERSPGGVVDEIEEALALGYEHIAFADDVFTLHRERVVAICDEIDRRGLRFTWECLGRVDALDEPIAQRMRRAGCTTVFFGIESGSDEVLRLMNKKTTAAESRDAVLAAHRAGLEVGAFFILCYPGETDDTVLETLRFAASLPLDYLGLSMPYPLPGTGLRERVRGRVTHDSRPDGSFVLNQDLTFEGDFSARKMRFAILKGRAESMMRRRLGRFAPAALRLTQGVTDEVFRRLS